MKRIFSSRFIAAAAFVAAALGAASAAQAHPDVHLSIGLPGLPVIVQPRPVYGPPPVVVYERQGGPSHRNDFERERAWRHAEWQRREWDRREMERRERDHRHHDRYPSHSHGRD